MVDFHFLPHGPYSPRSCDSKTYNLARTLGIRRTPKCSKGNKKGRSVEVRPFLFSSSFLCSGSQALRESRESILAYVVG